MCKKVAGPVSPPASNFSQRARGLQRGEGSRLPPAAPQWGGSGGGTPSPGGRLPAPAPEPLGAACQAAGGCGRATPCAEPTLPAAARPQWARGPRRLPQILAEQLSSSLGERFLALPPLPPRPPSASRLICGGRVTAWGGVELRSTWPAGHRPTSQLSPLKPAVCSPPQGIPGQRRAAGIARKPRFWPPHLRTATGSKVGAGAARRPDEKGQEVPCWAPAIFGTGRRCAVPGPPWAPLSTGSVSRLLSSCRGSEYTCGVLTEKVRRSQCGDMVVS